MPTLYIFSSALRAKRRESLYHSTDQRDGKAAHASLDTKTYTTAKKVLQTIEVYSETYGLGGKIDIYDSAKKLLTERKKKIKVIYDGYIYQLYAQYHCLTEMGYEVKSMKLYSLDDNKSYSVALPHDDPPRQLDFEQLIYELKTFDLSAPFVANPNKCTHCIYSQLCDVAAC